MFVFSKAVEQVLESIPQLVINAIYISRTHEEGDSWFTFPILSLVASAVSIFFFLIRFPKTYREMEATLAKFKENGNANTAENGENAENGTQNAIQNK